MSTESRSILITSASGNIGRSLIPLLSSNPSSKSWKLVLPTRDASRLSSLLPSPIPSNVIVAEGDTSNCVWIESLLRTHSVDTVLSNFSGIEELVLTLNFWDTCERAGVKHLVFVSACFDCSPQAVINGALKNLSAAHCAAKFPLEQKLMYGSPKFTWTVLGPTLFFGNDSMVKAHVLSKGLYNAPLGRAGSSRVDNEDIALAVLRAFEDRGRVYHGKKILLGSRKMYTGQEIAQIWGQALGKEVKTAEADAEGLQELEEEIAGWGMGRAWARDLPLMFKQFDIDGFGMNDEQYEEQVEFLGKTPSSYEEYVIKTAELWKAETK